MKKLLQPTTYNLKPSRGFTLIETLVALSIFSTSIVVLIYLTSSGVANTNTAKNKFIASYLAQEGVEMARNIRDTAFLSGADWEIFSGKLAACAPANGCTIEPATLTVPPCLDLGCPVINYDASGFYNYLTGTPSIFTRTIIATDTGSSYETNVSSVVSWLQGAKMHSVAFSENLLDWIK